MCAPRGVRVLRGARKGAEAVCRLPFALLPRRRLFGLTRAITPLSVLAAGGGGSGWVSPRRPLPPSLPSAVCHWGISKGVCLPEITQLPSVPLAAAYRAGYCQSPPQKSYSIFFFPCNAVLCVASNPHRNHTAFFFFPFLFFFSSPALCIFLGIARGQPQNQTTFCPPVLYWAFPESPHPEQSYTSNPPRPPPPSPPAPNKKIPHVIHSVVCIVLGTDRGPPTNSLFFLPVPYT